MEAESKEAITELLELMNRGNYFRILKPDTDNSFNATLKVSCYSELNTMVSSLLKSSINMLQNETSINAAYDAMILLEIALQLLPNSEMELVDKLHKLDLEGKKIS